MVASLLPNGKQQFIDANGAPLVGGTVTFYIPETSTFKDTWQDPGQTIFNTNPIVLDDRGQAIIYGSGQYRQVLKDADGNLIWDQLTSDYSAGGSGAGIQYGAQLVIVSASTTDISTITTHNAIITGTETIDSFGANADTNNPTYIVQFTDALTLTYNASTFILPGAQDIVTAANDSSVWMYLGSGAWQCIEYTVAAASSPTPLSLQSQNFTASGTFTTPANTVPTTQFKFTAVGGGGGGGGAKASVIGAGGGGGSGGIGVGYFSGFSPSQAITITPGTGGAAGSSAGGTGGTGAATTIVANAITIMSSSGGTGGGGNASVQSPLGGAAGTATITAGASGLTLVSSYSALSQAGADSTGLVSGAGGSNSFGAGGAGHNNDVAGTAGVRGGGGSGGTDISSGIARAGGAGGVGFVLVEWVG